MITALLVANRGEIARRVFRTARSLGIRCVAVYVDADATAPFVREADDAVRLSSGYLDGQAIVAAARAAGADAVHPGYGFLSENAEFAASVIAAGLTWIGPSPDVIASMGDKLAAKRAAQQAGVPILPSSEDPSAGNDIGFPLLVKAAAGGGGKGMRIVTSAGDVGEAVDAARREARAAFGDDRIFVERFVARSRHVEIQIIGDAHGNVVHLGERECSIQRRHQKIIEESPSPVVDDQLREAMCGAAVRLASSIGYQSAGTVEFLVDDDTRQFYFLEVNTRLQVEHPVTEEITGLDLVALQLRVAEGQSLDLAAVQRRGHAIEARLYAEDPAAGFLPATGTLSAFQPDPGDGVRWDSGVERGSVVGLQFDPMLAKVIAWGHSRVDASRRLASALERLHVGGVTTNRDFLVATLRHPAFIAGATTTDFIEREQPQSAAGDVWRAARVGALWLQGRNRASSPVLRTLPSGWRNSLMPSQRVELRHEGEPIEVAYRTQRDRSFVFHDETIGRVHGWSPTTIDVEIDGRRARHQIASDATRLYVQMPTGTLTFELVPRFALPGSAALVGSLVAPMPGLVLDVRCAVGDCVAKLQTLVVLEAMKMEHHVLAPNDGVVSEVLVAAGQQVDTGAVLLVLDTTDDDAAIHDKD